VTPKATAGARVAGCDHLVLRTRRDLAMRRLRRKRIERAAQLIALVVPSRHVGDLYRMSRRCAYIECRRSRRTHGTAKSNCRGERQPKTNHRAPRHGEPHRKASGQAGEFCTTSPRGSTGSVNARSVRQPLRDNLQPNCRQSHSRSSLKNPSRANRSRQGECPHSSNCRYSKRAM
jgi:hypothetical protein